ncbi:MAG: MltA domain-containing protein [Alphaproteobacteria bacterium]|nr:MltA domain-containing protein [Alphaproteobacteria bacterium]MBN2675601.1 MltA domain-containing protein [Alphaproteobacteria bacterium]
MLKKSTKKQNNYQGRLPFLMASIFSLFILTSCDLGGPNHVGDSSNIPSNLKKASYSELPGWHDDDVRYALQAFRNTCKAKIQYNGKVVPDRELLEEKCKFLPSASADVETVRNWFESHFQPYQIYDNDYKTKGTYTGYYSPMIPACKTQTTACNEPIMGLPEYGQSYKGVDKRTIVNKKIGKVLYWANIVDVQNLQIQGSGMLRLEDGKLIKINFAGVNDMPFKSIGEQLQAKKIRPDGGYSSDAVWTYLKKNPELAKEVIYNNPRYVYFIASDSHNVIGKLGTPLSKIRSVAMDDSIYTLGLPIYINTNLSDGRKFRRLMIAQDTGSAIRGWIRADIFFGKGEDGYKFAHGQHAQGEMFILMPKEYIYVKPSK